MSPIDDELRAALHRRATGLAPSPDPLSGIERRAGRLQRNRIAASVAGSVLAVAAVATAVPLLGGAVGPSPDAPPVAGPPSGLPSPEPTSLRTPSPYALDPAVPWDYRGAPLAELGTGTVETVRQELAIRRAVDASSVALSPLFGQVYEPSAQVELVFVAQVDGAASWGVARSSEAGPELLVDEPLEEGTKALVAGLPGDEAGRLLVVAAPEVGDVEYAPDGAGEFGELAVLSRGVATGPLEGNAATDAVRVLDPRGAEVFRGPAPDVASPSAAAPANLLSDWPERGTTPPELREAAERAFARALGQEGAAVDSRVLFGGDDDAGNAFVLMQAWRAGDDAHTFGYTVRPDGEPVPFLGPKTDPGTPVLAMLVEAAPGQSTDTLVLVPQPRTGQVLYAEAAGEPRPVGEGQALDGVVLVDRTPGTTGDRLRLLDGNGDLDNPTFDGSVADLLCGLQSCG